MITLHPEYIVDQKEVKKSIVLPFKEWEYLMEEMECLEDIRAFDEAKNDNDISVPFEQAVREIRNNAIL